MKIVRLALLIGHLGILLLLFGVLLNAYVPPRIFPWFNILSLAFPVLISIYGLLTVLWIFMWKKRAFVFMLFGLFFFSAAQRWVNYSTSKEKESLKIITLNTKSGTFGREEIEDYMNDKGADIILLQEDGNLPYQFTGLKKAKERPLSSLYSKYEIVGYKEIFEGMYSEDFNAFADYTDLKINNKTVRLFNIYLQPFKFEKSMVKLNGNSAEDENKIKNIIRKLIPTFKMHQDQITMIRKYIDNSPYPVIMTGDFNAVPNSYEYYHLGRDLQDAFVKVGKGSATSFHDYKYPLRLDYVFTSESIVPVSYNVDHSVKISDHYPVSATFKISN
ncbi:AP endonuclease [Chryseobacterium sp. Leaf404]|uniref:endonuclease/exonuclease/phosphatase family protein n=1 Tax=unclassified Chryseobacterium TaxID=2593645 RepID=UPI000701A5A0|nr:MULTISPECIES: endonuclease/exonuclease/phosphatase family protein [unclassified Chryseobacterium]KQT22375.1 AP endonuclease [Chryseobacterium sp. Leaf404]